MLYSKRQRETPLLLKCLGAGLSFPLENLLLSSSASGPRSGLFRAGLFPCPGLSQLPGPPLHPGGSCSPLVCVCVCWAGGLPAPHRCPRKAFVQSSDLPSGWAVGLVLCIRSLRSLHINLLPLLTPPAPTITHPDSSWWGGGLATFRAHHMVPCL